VDFAATFGSECPAPDFARLRSVRPPPPLRVRTRYLASALLLAVGAGVVLSRRLGAPERGSSGASGRR
jgi:hypothetical protein